MKRKCCWNRCFLYKKKSWFEQHIKNELCRLVKSNKSLNSMILWRIQRVSLGPKSYSGKCRSKKELWDSSKSRSISIVFFFLKGKDELIFTLEPYTMQTMSTNQVYGSIFNGRPSDKSEAKPFLQLKPNNYEFQCWSVVGGL